MKKIALIALIIGTIELMGCGEPKVNEAYNQYISDAKMEILNQNFEQANKYLILAQDEKVKDTTAKEMKEHLDLYTELEYAYFNFTGDLIESYKALISKANSIISSQRDSDIIVDLIKEKANILTETIETHELAIKKSAKAIEHATTLGEEITPLLEDGNIGDAYAKTLELMEELNIIRDSGMIFTDKEYELENIVNTVTQLSNGYLRLDEEKKSPTGYMERYINEFNNIIEEGETVVVEYVTGDNYLTHHIVVRTIDGMYKRYVRMLIIIPMEHWTAREPVASIYDAIKFD